MVLVFQWPNVQAHLCRGVIIFGPSIARIAVWITIKLRKLEDVVRVTGLHFHCLKEYYPNRGPTNLSRPGDYSAEINFERVTGVMIVHPRSLCFARDLAHLFSSSEEIASVFEKSWLGKEWADFVVSEEADKDGKVEVFYEVENWRPICVDDLNQGFLSFPLVPVGLALDLYAAPLSLTTRHSTGRCHLPLWTGVRDSPPRTWSRLLCNLP